MESKLLNGDNIELLRELEENSVDSIVTDPPYGLSFMNKKWDYDVPSTEFWKEVYRVLKPGGHVLSFGGTRTYHRMVVNMEDAGFEIRDQIQWLYGSGFPKNHNIGKAYDKKMDNDREVVGKDKSGVSSRGFQSLENTTSGEYDITKGNSPYEGWGTALKPANEPICLARKPLSEKTIVDNVIEWETGGMNIDECRVGLLDGENTGRNNKDGDNGWKNSSGGKNGNKLREDEGLELLGRWPANVILECICDEVIKGEKGEVINRYPGGTTFGGDKKINDEVVGTWFNDKGDIHTNPNCPCRLLDEHSGERKVGKGKRSGGFQEGYIDGEVKNRVENEGYNDSGGASRFFYSAKVSKKERNMGIENNNHPTIKPVSLMAYLCRLITPKGGVVLDPFMGSGSTGISALLEDFNFIGMEMDEEYFKIAESRINNYEEYREFVKK
jgi:site-specific DNA-methyltransferase (adenine-specific)